MKNINTQKIFPYKKIQIFAAKADIYFKGKYSAALIYCVQKAGKCIGGSFMKHSLLIPITAALLVVFGAALIAMTFVPAETAVSHTYTTKYSWYIVPQGSGNQPVLADDETFKDNYDVVYLGSPEEKTVWLTFDLGYDNGNTDKILDALKAADVQGAFFICGNVIDSCPVLVKRMTDEGHMVFNHTDKHKDLSEISKDEMIKQLGDLENKYLALTGKNMPKVVRPPGGSYSESCLADLTEMGYTTMFWSFAYKDWIDHDQPSPEKAVNKVMERLHPGMVALLHSTSATNAEILPELISRIQNEGYRFGRFDELLKK